MTASSPPPRRILVRLPNPVGDAVMATPALRALRAGHPQAWIAVEGRPALRPLLAGLPRFDAFLVDPGRGARAARTRARTLREGRFDWALLLPDSVRTALGPRVAGIPRRVGYARDPLRRALLTEALEPPRRGGRRLPIPMVERYLRITRRVGCADRGRGLELRVDPAAARRVADDLAARGVPAAAGILLVTPGAGFGPSKRWPPEHFARACDLLARHHGLYPVVAPAPGERGIAEAVAARAREPLALRPCADLAELVALVAAARLVLSNDTGPRHVAAALGRPSIVLLGPTDPRHSARRLAPERVLREEVACSPCQLPVCPIDHRCMTRLAPERVLEAAGELLG